MSPIAVATILLALSAALLAGGCQSTQDKSAELEAKGGEAFKEKGLKVKVASKDVKVRSKTVLSDENGAAVVVELENKTDRALVKVPVAIDVTDGKKSVFKNDDPGIEPSLAGVALLGAGESIFWVHDQVLATGKVSAVEVKPGKDKGGAPEKLPKIDVGPAKLVTDATSGVAAEGKVINRSDILQRELVIFGVARKGDEVVAAGRSQVEKLAPGKDATYQIFFIGNPRGARIELAAPPTALE
jgi:hypothetical protein